MAITAQELNVILSARDRQFSKAMDRAQKRVERFANKSKAELSRTTTGFNHLAGAAKRFAPALAAAFSVSALQNMVETTAEIGNLSDMAGVSTSRFQELAFASANFGVQQDKLADILKDVNDKFGDYAATGQGPLADFFENIAPKVGLTADAFEDLSSEQKLGAYVNALEVAGVSSQEMTFYMEALASDATLLTKAFANNGAEVDRLSRKLRDAGGVMDENLIKQAKDAKEELAVASAIIKANLNVALAELIPLVVGGAEAFAKIATNIGVAFEAVQNLLNPTGQLETAIDNVVLAMSDEIRQSQQLNIQLGKSKDMSVAMAQEKLEEAEARHANAQAAIDEARALQLQSPAFKNLQERLGNLYEMQQSIGIATSNVEDRNTRSSASFEELQSAIANTHHAISILLTTDQDLSQQLDITADNIETLRTALANAKDGMVSFGNGMVEPIEKSDRLKTKTKENTQSLQELIDKLDLSAVTLERLGLGAGATEDDLENLRSAVGVLDSSMEDAFLSMAEGSKSFGDAMREMARDVIRELLRVYVVQRMVQGIKSTFGIPDFGSLNAQGAAHGRQLHAGKPYMTGESGRELFVPSTSGRLLSPVQTNRALSGGDTIEVSQTINVTTGVSQTVRAEIMSMMPQIAEVSKAAVLDAKQRGGAYGRAL